MKERMDLRKSYFPGKYIQGNGAINDLPDLIDLYGGKAFILLTPSMKDTVMQRGLAEGQTVEIFRGPCCWQEVDRLIELVKKDDYTVIVGIGGGKVVDTAKVIADKLNLRVIMAPSVASSSAPYSSCSVMYTPENIYESVYYEKHSPDVLLVDNQVIINAKPRYLVAGMADSLAVLFEGRACLKNEARNSLGAKQPFFAVALSQYCFDMLIKYGEQAKAACETKVVTPALERIIEVNLMTAGIAFEGTGLAAAHAIHNGLTLIPEVHNYIHGEIVAFGVLCELFLSDAEPQEMDLVYDFCERVGLPTTLAQLGIANFDRDTVFAAAKMTVEDPYLPHEGKYITAEDVFAAIVSADAMGKARKAKA